MDIQKAWEKFAQTGLVQDYLVYTALCSTDEPSRQEDAMPYANSRAGDYNPGESVR